VTDTTQKRPQAASNPVLQSQWGWVAAALGAHMAWGLYPVLARYLQTVSNLPTFSILLFGNVVVLVTIGRFLWKRTDIRILRLPIVWVFLAIVIVRATTNIASTRFTLAIYVQLITQATPFIVILMSTVFFRERVPRFTVPAVVLSVIGAVMMIGTDFGGGVANDPTRQDWLGVGLAAASVVALATYMVMVRRSVKHAISGEALLLVQLVGIIIVSGGMSVGLGEGWKRYLEMGGMDWAVLLFFTFAVFLGANLGQIQAIRHIGAPFVSSLLASRLVSALIFGALLLGENLESVWQVVGAGIVLVTITWYLWQQR
jgi:drug/metabolite transporter (DMT)-like permease